MQQVVGEALPLDRSGGTRALAMGVVFASNEQFEAPPSAHEPVRVLHVYSGNLFGGVEWFLRTLATYGGHVPWMSTEFALCFDAKIAQELRDRGAIVHILGPARVRSRRQTSLARQALADVLVAGRYDVVVCHSAWPHVIFAPVVRKHGTRLVQFMHDVPNPRGWIDHLANRTAPDVVMCNTHFMETAGPWWFRDVPRRMVRYPVPVRYSDATGARAALRQSLGARPDDVVILHASRMQAWKGHRVLIEALHRIRTNPRWTCWIAGGAQRAEEKAYENELRVDVERFGLGQRVHFLGQRDDVPALMEASDIYCQPNVAPEPFGVSFLEALAAGLPVVTTAMGAPLEIIDATCGILVDRAARKLPAELARLVDDDERRALLSKGGPPRARALCDVETRIREFGDALASVKASPPAPPRAASSVSPGGTDAVLSAVAQALRERAERIDTIVDLGCGRGDCARHLGGLYREYLGADLVEHRDFPRSATVDFREVDLNRERYPFDDASADAVVSVETIEQIENPRALVREMARIVRPGGWIVVTTPNQLSMTSKLGLVMRNQFPAFEEGPGRYPAHISALIEGDLLRLARECGLVEIGVQYTNHGRVPFPARRWPANLGPPGRWFSDNVLLVARRPLEGESGLAT